jgi:Fe-S-cluster containining protein
MQELFDFSAYARQVRKLFRVLMANGADAAGVSRGVHLLTTMVEKDLVRFKPSPEDSRVACGPGCGACCVLNVAVLFPEAVAITRFLRRHFSAVEINDLQARLEVLVRKTCWLDDEERLFLREPCAFLDNLGSCLIHPVRPLLCRSITSTDAQTCRDAIAMVALYGAPDVEMDLFQKKLFDTVYCEFGWTLECLGLDHRPMRLSAAALALLEKPGLVDLFLAGDSVPVH